MPRFVGGAQSVRVGPSPSVVLAQLPRASVSFFGEFGLGGASVKSLVVILELFVTDLIIIVLFRRLVGCVLVIIR